MTQPLFAKELDLRDAPAALCDRFWSKVDVGDPTECWEWKNYRSPSGYGQFMLRKGVFITGSRAALAFSGVVIRTGEVACHRCDNPPCCNPSHLFVGTQSDNAIDSVNKGRARRALGEATRSPLAESEVLEILAAPEQFGMMARFAKRFGVDQSSIRRIRSGESWSHLGVRANTAKLCVHGHELAGANLLDRKASPGTLCATCAESYRVSRLVS